MLGRLLKYETKATARLFLPMYLAILIFALINKIINPFDAINSSTNFNLQTSLSFISIMLYFVLIVGIVVMTLVIMIQRFYKNLLGDEGYLMFTLPVKSWKHIVSKLLVSMLWVLLSFIIIVSSVAILIGIENILAEFPRMITNFIDIFGYNSLFIMPLYSILALASFILMIYSSISLGHLFPKRKLLASFVMYCVLYIIYQIVMVLFMVLFGNTFFASIITTGTPTPHQINMFVLSLTSISVVLGIANFILINIILKKWLNLE